MPAAEDRSAETGFPVHRGSIRGFIKRSRNCLPSILFDIAGITLGKKAFARARAEFRFSAESEKYYTVARLTDVPSSLSRYQLRGLSK